MCEACFGLRSHGGSFSGRLLRTLAPTTWSDFAASCHVVDCLFQAMSRALQLRVFSAGRRCDPIWCAEKKGPFPALPWRHVVLDSQHLPQCCMLVFHQNHFQDGHFDVIRAACFVASSLPTQPNDDSPNLTLLC